jgi:hypothetical protein
MTIGTQFVRGSNPVWYFVDLVGNQTDGSFYLWTLTNTIPYIPQAVFHDVNGLIPWTDPIEFLANGTLPIDIFFDDTQVYRLEIRQNNGLAPPSQADALIYLVENYIPNGSGGGITPFGSGIISGNEITNPQFSLVNFSLPLLFTTAGTTEIAPGWFLTLTGSGLMTVTRIPLNTTFPNPTNAPYALSFNSSGWSNPPVLSQRFYQNGMNWQNKTVATSITARIDNASQNILVRLTASNGNNIAVLINAPLTNTFTEFQGNDLIPTFANLNLPPNAYIDYQIILPQNGVSYVTSVQVTESATVGNVEYIQDTINRQLDYTFHYYMPKLEYKPIPSWLVGWDFPLNPAQILGSTVATQALGANTGFYAWDQTIVYQDVTSAVSVSRATNGGITLTSNGVGQVALIQYLDQARARKILSDRISVNINGSTTSAAGSLAGNVTLWATTDANAPSLPTTFITTIGANGVPFTVSGAWVQVPNLWQNTAFTLEPASTTNSENADIMLNGWDEQGAAICNTATFFAIVVGLSVWADLDTVTFNSISLCSGDIATRPAPKTHDETLRDSEYFYEKSYQASTIPTAGSFPANTTYNALSAPMMAAIPASGSPYTTYVLEAPFTFEFRTLKRAPTTQTYPSVTIYSEATGAANNVSLSAVNAGVTAVIGDDAIATWGTKYIGNKFATFLPTTNSALTSPAFNATTPPLFYIRYHYVADARIGVVN